ECGEPSAVACRADGATPPRRSAHPALGGDRPLAGDRVRADRGARRRARQDGVRAGRDRWARVRRAPVRRRRGSRARGLRADRVRRGGRGVVTKARWICLVVAALVVEAIAVRLGVIADPIPKLAGTEMWTTSRAAGVTAFGALTLDVLFGLFVSTGAIDRW